MDPLQEEQTALSQQEEFESRLFAEDEYVVIACAPVTKLGVNDRSGVPKQYFLVLTVNKNDINDCKLNTVRIKNNGNDLVIQKSPKLNKLKWFEIVDDEHHSYDFKLYWKNGSNESFILSPNTLRKSKLFAFIIPTEILLISSKQTTPMFHDTYLNELMSSRCRYPQTYDINYGGNELRHVLLF